MKKGLSALLLASLLCASSGCQQNQKEVVNEYNIVPMPNQMTPQEGRFLLSNKVSVVTAGCTPEVQAIADSLIAQIQLTSGISLKTSSQENPEQPDIRFVTEEGMPKEGYKLSIAPNEIIPFGITSQRFLLWSTDHVPTAATRHLRKGNSETCQLVSACC